MDNLEKAVFGAGCFWCVEAMFQDLQGVEKVQSGYMGGQKDNPTYKEVCTGTTGHAEVLLVHFDPTIISYEELLLAFWQVHDPTQLNRQGNDVGTQYRSAVFYYTEEQKTAAEHSMEQAQEEHNNSIVTEITSVDTFFPAEDYHTDYFNLHGENPYCSAVISPKVKKFRKIFAGRLK
ncbi:MAG: peptide-methionine (S)-S-oxide reductase MsrA [Aureispira sp.]